MVSEFARKGKMRLSKLVRVSLGLLAFNLADPATSTGQSLVKEEVSIVERGPHHKVIQRVSWLTNTGSDGEYQNDAYYRFDITLEQK
jgi:hypothetical protein